MLIDDINSSKELNPKERREALRAYANKQGVGQMFMLLRGEDDRRAVLRALADLAVLPAAGEIIAHYMDIDRPLVLSLLNDADAKTRKTAAELTGRLAADAFAEALAERLLRERSHFVVPSLVLAIGRTKNAAELLRGYVIPEDCEQKHREAIADALRKASAPRTTGEAHINPLLKGARLLLSCPSKAVTRRELSDLGIANADCPFRMNAVFADGLSRYEDILRALTFYDASVYIGKDTEATELSKAITLLFGERTLYRVELTSDTTELSNADRRAEAARIAAKLKEHVNSPSAYICTLNIHRTPRGDHYSLRPSVSLDRRFELRRAAISASIHPAVAASVVYFAKEWLRPQHSVLDCFCGAGTLLFARARFPFASLTGTDVSEEALKAARQNERSYKLGARFVKKNALAPFRDRFDEVIANMPFGLRVSDHSANVHLYREFLEALPAILTENGVAMLFTQEKELITKYAAKHPELALAAKHTFAAGGLYPSLYVFTVEKR